MRLSPSRLTYSQPEPNSITILSCVLFVSSTVHLTITLETDHNGYTNHPLQAGELPRHQTGPRDRHVLVVTSIVN